MAIHVDATPLADSTPATAMRRYLLACERLAQTDPESFRTVLDYLAEATDIYTLGGEMAAARLGMADGRIAAAKDELARTVARGRRKPASPDGEGASR